VSALGAAVGQTWSNLALALGAALGAVAVVYALHELEFVRLPVPGRDWQVPADWVRHGFYRSAIIFGGAVGFGVFTRVPFASFPVLLAWLFVAGNPLYGVIAGLVYGGTRALSIFSSASCREPADVAGLNQRLMALSPVLHQVTGLALGAFGAYLLLATAVA